jgi:hypothetical protein
LKLNISSSYRRYILSPVLFWLKLKAFYAYGIAGTIFYKQCWLPVIVKTFTKLIMNGKEYNRPGIKLLFKNPKIAKPLKISYKVYMIITEY